MLKIELDNEQCRKVTLEYIAHMLTIQKQYLNESQIAKYKFILNEFATLNELEEISKRFDNAWPRDILWNTV